MGSMNTIDIGNILQRAKVQKDMENLVEQLRGNIPNSVVGTDTRTQSVLQNTPQSPGPVQAPPQALTNTNRDLALSNYMQTLNQGAPQLSQYHPSLGRKIGAGILGAIAGIHDPKSGYEVGSGIRNAPFNRQISDYQQRLAERKQAFETEEKSTEDTARIQEQEERAKAETERAGAEKARRLGEEYKVSPPGLRAKEEEYLREHPQKIEKVRVPLKNGQIVNADRNTVTGELVTEDATGAKIPIGLNAIDSTKNITPAEEKEITPKQIYDESRAGFVDPTNKTFTPIPGITPKPGPETPEEKEATWQKHFGAERAAADARQERSIAASKEKQESSFEHQDTKISPQSKARAEVANSVLKVTPEIESLLKKTESKLGPAKGRWNEFLTGKVGAGDPDFAELRDRLKFLSAQVVIMHTGSRGGTAYLKEFNDLLDPGKLTPENLRRALKVTKSYASDYAAVGKGKKQETDLDEKGTFDELLKR